MKTYRIYTAGFMSGTTYDYQMKWRNKIEERIKQKTDKSVEFIHPPLFYNYECTNHKTQKEIKDWELRQLATCDIMIVNIENINNSVGCHYELATADAINSYCTHNIFVIGYGEKEVIHPWIEDTIFRQEDNIEKLTDYIVDYLLI